MKTFDSGWSEPYFGIVTRSIGPWKLSLADYARQGCVCTVENRRLRTAIRYKSFLDKDGAMAQTLAEDWLLAQVPADMVDPNKPRYDKQSIGERVNSPNFGKELKSKSSALSNRKGVSYIAELNGVRLSSLTACCRYLLGGESEYNRPIIEAAQISGLCLRDVRRFTPTPAGIAYAEVQNSLDRMGIKEAQAFLSGVVDHKALILVSYYLAMTRSRPKLKQSVIARIAEIEQGRQPRIAS